ncbi:winged helix-turn-helix transcriptional regulator [Halococcus sp. PRR34]|uniref:winged helix-turn-helix transcriptional regulator n=1 Tax=Halococcus sp. PRR34 TaxID=3020830 RepID=UPI00235F5BB0|nr:winged helix-turn-helix transcriptional regulator [Halococcus sp. PRR34]
MSGGNAKSMHSAVDEVVCPKRSLEILDYLSEHDESNFSTIEDAVPTSSDVVTERLETLQEYGLVEREERSSRNVRYSLTQDGGMFLTHLEEVDEFLQNSRGD